ncbi:MAG: hypothetical protein EOQ44_25390 [Mesorhizobium sp.]|uniref:hypothetical protein n=1 Tax=Mesorhizobium sp. TaxID=1871066 RepID=UPI000FE95852|nr:hypothetical protein [Mesorhizobium sp.]RWB40475.1 MAG: hypothetical protein EOQ44_25390 [Mesorhizobium sp.]
MNLYHWAHADCIREYAAGDIIVMAPSVDEARELARDRMDDYLKEHRSWWWSYDTEGKLDENYVEDYDNFKRKFEADLVQEPDLIGEQTIFIRGSE